MQKRTREQYTPKSDQNHTEGTKRHPRNPKGALGHSLEHLEGHFGTVLVPGRGGGRNPEFGFGQGKGVGGWVTTALMGRGLVFRSL